MCKLQDLRSHNVPGGLLPDGVWLVTHGYEWLRGVLGTSNDAQPPPSPFLSVPHPRDKRAPPCLAWVGGGGAEDDRVSLVGCSVLVGVGVALEGHAIANTPLAPSPAHF